MLNPVAFVPDELEQAAAQKCDCGWLNGQGFDDCDCGWMSGAGYPKDLVVY